MEIGSYEKNTKEEVRVSIEEFRGKPFINIRVFYRNGSEEWLPGKQGLTVSPEQYRELAALLVQAGEHLADRGVLRLSRST